MCKYNTNFLQEQKLCDEKHAPREVFYIFNNILFIKKSREHKNKGAVFKKV